MRKCHLLYFLSVTQLCVCSLWSDQETILFSSWLSQWPIDNQKCKKMFSACSAFFCSKPSQLLGLPERKCIILQWHPVYGPDSPYKTTLLLSCSAFGSGGSSFYQLLWHLVDTSPLSTRNCEDETPLVGGHFRPGLWWCCVWTGAGDEEACLPIASAKHFNVVVVDHQKQCKNKAL